MCHRWVISQFLILMMTAYYSIQRSAYTILYYTMLTPQCTDDTTGIHSIYTVIFGKEIMFHVSTLLPHSKDNPQQVCILVFLYDIWLSAFISILCYAMLYYDILFYKTQTLVLIPRNTARAQAASRQWHMQHHIPRRPSVAIFPWFNQVEVQPRVWCCLTECKWRL